MMNQCPYVHVKIYVKPNKTIQNITAEVVRVPVVAGLTLPH